MYQAAPYLEAMLHLLAKYLEIRPLFFCFALPMKEEWKMRPYLGVLPLVFRALKSAFSAPRICTVDAGYFAKLVKEPTAEPPYHNKAHSRFLVILCIYGRLTSQRTVTGHGKQLPPSNIDSPACDMSLAPTISPISADRFGATTCILSSRYV